MLARATRCTCSARRAADGAAAPVSSRQSVSTRWSSRSVWRSLVSTMRRRRAVATASVMSRTASSGSCANRAMAFDILSGSPITTRAHPARNIPGWWKTRPTGSTGTSRPGSARSAPRTSLATPVRSGMRVGSGWLIPSGKIRMPAPPRRVSMARANMGALRAGSVAASPSWRRWTGMAPTSRRIGPTSGWRKSGALAIGTSWRGMVATRRAGSTRALWWLATMTRGPLAGTCSSPTISTR